MGFGTRRLLLSLIVFAAMPARADFAAGLAAYERGDYVAAMDEWQTLAVFGDAEATYRMACLHDRGQGVEPDAGKAAAWYHRAAEAGHPWAQMNLGEMYFWGDGQPTNIKEARKWFLKAAEQGLADAQMVFGIWFATRQKKRDSNGRFTQHYIKKAIPWFEKAARQGLAEAAFALGKMYILGEGPRHNEEKGTKLIRRAAEKGFAQAQASLGSFYAKGLHDLEKNPSLGAKWMRKAAEQGLGDAQHLLGLMYRDGRGVEQDFPTALKWLLKAAEWGDSRTDYALGRLYQNGRGLDRNEFEAYYWFKRAHRVGYEEAEEPMKALAKSLTEEQRAQAHSRAKKEASRVYRACPRVGANVLSRKQTMVFRMAEGLRGIEARECPP